MKMWMDWVGYRDDNNEKYYLWGIIHAETETEYGIIHSRYIFYTQCDSGLIHLRETLRSTELLLSTTREKINNGYKRITQMQLEDHWPSIINDIEMEFTMMRLKQ